MTDSPGRERIIAAALRLFAERGAAGVSVRDIAAAAEVSPALIPHHFGTKEGLEEAVDDHVAGLFDTMLDGLEESHALADATSFAELVLGAVPAGSPIPQYLRRLLLEGGPGARTVFARWMDLSRAAIARLDGTGVMKPSADPEARAAFLLVNDLAMFLLHDRIAEAIGDDPLSESGSHRWTREAMASYTHGVFTAPPQPETPPHPASPAEEIS
ncbi:TetR/AcrR family transcriptional regulator [uncultured Demequina sp.]|uniref:TetR/AcrR family transcriptional regulator n=1 Tax=uncultured Demequina sp. TaxID=693499 RepID=UPI0025E105AF|nr:TetR/AcrR family transcriptional regulator [uncultured Demequina sp.]